METSFTNLIYLSAFAALVAAAWCTFFFARGARRGIGARVVWLLISIPSAVIVSAFLAAALILVDRPVGTVNAAIEHPLGFLSYSFEAGVENSLLGMNAAPIFFIFMSAKYK